MAIFNKSRWMLVPALCTTIGLGVMSGYFYAPDLLSDHPILKQIEKNLDDYQTNLSPEKVYLHLNKTFFEPGDDIWFSAYVRDAQNLKASTKSEILYVELQDAKGSVLQKINIIARDGQGAGDFKLDENIAGGLYKIKAYTKWQQNTNDFFEREITVQRAVLPNLNMQLNFDRKAYSKGDKVIATVDLNTLENKPLSAHNINYKLKLDGLAIDGMQGQMTTDNIGRTHVTFDLPQDLATNDGLLEITLDYKGQTESISRSVPIVLGNVDVQFFPEGGDWLAGMEGGMAFKAVDEFGKPADISGRILNKKGEEITTFSSYHQGMGSFEMTPIEGEKYTVEITQPSSSQQTFDLPKALKKGKTLRIDRQEKEYIIIDICTSEAEEVFLVGQSGGKMYYSQELKALQGVNSLYIPTQGFPIGTMQFTLFDSKQVALSERLVFVNPHQQLNVEVKTDKEKYLPREEVNMTIEVTDEAGQPVSGDFSVAVVDEKVLSFADDKQGHLLSAMLLESDLTGKIVEPNFYFDDENDPTRLKPEIKRTKALDHLMMTQGWRKFVWQSVNNRQYPPMYQTNEMARLNGTIYNVNGQPIEGIKVRNSYNEEIATTDQNGQYKFNTIDLYDAVQLTAMAEDPYMDGAPITASNYLYPYNAYLYKKIEVQGIVKDGNGDPIKNVNITNPMGEVLGKSDKNGKYTITCAENIGYLYVQDVNYYGYGYVNANNASQVDIYAYNNNFNGIALQEVAIADAPRGGRGGGRRNKRAANNAPVVAGSAAIPAPAPDFIEVEEEMFFDMDAPAEVWDVNDAIVDDDLFLAAEIDTKNTAVAKKEEERRGEREENRRDEDGDSDGIVVEDMEFDLAMNERMPMDKDMKVVAPVANTYYYQARQFPKVDYKKQERVETRSDFRQTIYWNPAVHVENGQAKLSFSNSDDITQFRVTVEGFGTEGNLGRHEYKYFTQLPFGMVAKVPTDVLTGDVLNLPVTLSNNTQSDITGKLNVILPKHLSWVKTLDKNISLKAGESTTVLLNCKVKNELSEDKMRIEFESLGIKDAFETIVRTSSRGFPVRALMSGRELEYAYNIPVNEMVEGSMQAEVRVIPNTISEMMQGMESMLRQPGGCFEQTSSGNYPNVLVLNYLRETGTSNPELEKQVYGYMETGYAILSGYESPGGGFDWWGRSPAHEALTAYGIMQFIDMKKVFPVDDGLINRAAAWLLSRRDGSGSWQLNPQCAHTWVTNDVTDAYIVWSLAEAGYGNEIKKEIEKSYNDAIKSEDPYLMALVSNTMYKLNDKRGEELLNEIAKVQKEDGRFAGLTASVTNSTGASLDIETTGLVALAMLKDGGYPSKLAASIDYLRNSKGYYGYGNTQGTVLALKAIVGYTKASKKTAEGGSLAVYVDGKKVGTRTYKKDQEEIEPIDISSYLKNGTQKVEVKFEGTKEAVPMELEISYASRKPENATNCPLAITTKLATENIKQGETVRLTTTLSNISDKNAPMAMAMIGIPAGLSLQPWQLKELKEKHAFDYYEIFDGCLVLHYENIKKDETKTVNLDLKADIPGTYESQASSAFLYYTNNLRIWDDPMVATIQ